MLPFDVVICGAGPTGLMLANQLARFGIRFLIIDSKAEPTKESRALVVQARSMEIYEQMGLSDAIIDEGEKLDGMSFYSKGKRRAAVKLGDLAAGISPFPYIMIYEQNKNEALLNKALRERELFVQWNTTFKKYRETEKGFEVVVENNGEEKNISAKYLIACDGAKSGIRQQSGASFEGGTYENVFYVADTQVQANIRHDQLTAFLARSSITVLFPMRGAQRFRIIGILPAGYYHRPDINFDEMINHFRQTAQLPLQVHNTAWSSTYRIHHKKTEHFNKGKIFFAGDAAHVHSPAGGQGMNTGLQDAYNLAWKLAMVIQKRAGEKLLDTYHEERNPVAVRLLATTDRAFGFMTRQHPFYVFLRTRLLPPLLSLLLRSRFMRKRIFLTVSQTEIAYTKSSLSKGRSGGIKAGMRFPYTMIEVNKEQLSVYQYIHQYSRKSFLLMQYDIVADYQDNENIQLISIPVNLFNTGVFKKLGFSKSWIALLRPDMYIGYINDRFDKDDFSAYCRRLFLQL